jgi:hypothetical protein
MGERSTVAVMGLRPRSVVKDVAGCASGRKRPSSSNSSSSNGSSNNTGQSNGSGSRRSPDTSFTQQAISSSISAVGNILACNALVSVSIKRSPCYLQYSTVQYSTMYVILYNTYSTVQQSILCRRI